MRGLVVLALLVACGVPGPAPKKRTVVAQVLPPPSKQVQVQPRVERAKRVPKKHVVSLVERLSKQDELKRWNRRSLASRTDGDLLQSRRVTVQEVDKGIRGSAAAPSEPDAAPAVQKRHLGGEAGVVPVPTRKVRHKRKRAQVEEQVSSLSPTFLGVAKAHNSQVRYCHHASKVGPSAPEGRVVLDVEFRDGAVAAARVVSDSTGSDQLADCLVKRVSRWSVGTSSGRVTWPVIFRST